MNEKKEDIKTSINPESPMVLKPAINKTEKGIISVKNISVFDRIINALVLFEMSLL